MVIGDDAVGTEGPLSTESGSRSLTARIQDPSTASCEAPVGAGLESTNDAVTAASEGAAQASYSGEALTTSKGDVPP